MRGTSITPPFRTKPHPSLPHVAMSGWNTFKQGNKLPSPLLLTPQYVGEQVCFSLLEVTKSPQTSHLKCWGLNHRPVIILKQRLVCFPAMAWPCWLGYITVCHESVWNDLFLTGVGDMQTGNAVVNVDVEASAPLPLAEKRVPNQQSSSLAYQRVKVDLKLSGFILFAKATLPTKTCFISF